LSSQYGNLRLFFPLKISQLWHISAQKILCMLLTEFVFWVMVVQNLHQNKYWLGIRQISNSFSLYFAIKHNKVLHKIKVWCKIWDDATCIALIFGYYMIYDIIKIIFSNHKNIKLFYTIKLYICGHIPYIYVIALLI
jgi:hypothetical protein